MKIKKKKKKKKKEKKKNKKKKKEEQQRGEAGTWGRGRGRGGGGGGEAKEIQEKMHVLGSRIGERIGTEWTTSGPSSRQNRDQIGSSPMDTKNAPGDRAKNLQLSYAIATLRTSEITKTVHPTETLIIKKKMTVSQKNLKKKWKFSLFYGALFRSLKS